MTIFVDSILAFFSGLAGRFLTDTGLKFVAYKTLAVTLLTVVFPVVAKNLLQWLFEGMVSIAGSVPGINGLESATYQMAGFAAYLASQLMLADCISIILTAVVIRLCLNFIPMVG